MPPQGGLPPAPPRKSGLGTGAKVGIGAGALLLVAGGAFAATRLGGGTTTAGPLPTTSSASTVRTSASASASTSATTSRASASASARTSTSASASSKGTKRPDAATLGTDGALTSPLFTAKAPAGWKLSDNNGYKGRAMEVIDKDNNLLTLFDSDRGEPATVCKEWADDLKNDPADKVEVLAPSTWGGLPAVGTKLTTHNDDAGEDEIFIFTCAKKGTTVYVFAAVTWVDNEISVKAAADAVKGSWAWK